MRYYDLVHPHLTYGVLIWGSTYKSYLNTLQLLQNNAIRVTTKQRSSDRITPIYRRLQVLKINDLYKPETAKFIINFRINYFLHHLKIYQCKFRNLSLKKFILEYKLHLINQYN